MTCCVNAVFSCFKYLERATDRLTGAAGPVFITLALGLLGAGLATFFNVIQPDLPWITLPICILIATNLMANYYYVCTIPPGFSDDAYPPIRATPTKSIFWARPRHSSSRPRHFETDDELHSPHDERHEHQWAHCLEGISEASKTRCLKCGATKPERTHHCRVCKRCVLKYDHHCPVLLIIGEGINQCVGLYNERYFVLFMAYLVLGTFFYVTLGYQKIRQAFDLFYDWPHSMPAAVFVLFYILSVVLFLAVGVMLTWHLRAAMKGETSVEGHDHDVYKKLAKQRGETFVNSYDLGWRRNLELFFNVGPTGYPKWTLLLPLKTTPYTDGFAWIRRPGYMSHGGIREGEELTDEDD
ncbi:zf-DHHC-domain-containing protein [Sistotremastrum niveocremeum HHB9708]|uniref:Palmitoyltransferase n=2 Tax=Sistotremastraceae TaxID=3402574 RepID=A0A164TYH9_9AGAM|nr:zf-DHHC-domain-containing protein [Sistotremastrum niveocremeum HHB9708]KZT35790.1 zf-DHHC-domain-containing protein [Sistotremastrum suecicum HHB10207 ss-3]